MKIEKIEVALVESKNMAVKPFVKRSGLASGGFLGSVLNEAKLEELV